MKIKLFLILLTINSFSAFGQSVDEYFNSAVSEFKSGNYNASIIYLDTIISLDKSNVKAYDFRGFIKGQIEDYKGALEDFNTIIKLDPKNSTAFDHRGICKKNLKDYKGALADYNKALEP